VKFGRPGECVAASDQLENFSPRSVHPLSFFLGRLKKNSVRPTFAPFVSEYMLTLFVIDIPIEGDTS